MFAAAISSTITTAPNATAIACRNASGDEPAFEWIDPTLHSRLKDGCCAERLALTARISACAWSRLTPGLRRPTAPSQ